MDPRSSNHVFQESAVDWVQGNNVLDWRATTGLQKLKEIWEILQRDSMRVIWRLSREKEWNMTLRLEAKMDIDKVNRNCKNCRLERRAKVGVSLSLSLILPDLSIMSQQSETDLKWRYSVSPNLSLGGLFKWGLSFLCFISIKVLLYMPRANSKNSPSPSTHLLKETSRVRLSKEHHT